MKARNSLCVALASLAICTACRNVDLPESVRFVSSAEASGAAIHVNPSAGLVTSENGGAGGTATFAVSLTTKPVANVTVTLISNNTAEGQIKRTSGTCDATGSVAIGSCTLTFTNANWLNPQSVAVVGQNDDYADGNIAYAINFTAASADSDYNGKTATANLTNNDNDTAGFTATPATRLITKTNGSTATFQIQLSSRPTANVAFAVVSNDTTEGIVTSSASLTFTNANWNTAQNIVVTGQAADGDEPMDYKVVINGTVASADSNYAGITGTILHTGLDLRNVNAANKILFKKTNTSTGNLGGLTGADAQCNAASNKPVTGTYKAVVTHTTLRRACTTANCTNPAENIDWVLYPNITYVRPTGETIGTTNAAGIFIFPLNNEIDTAGFTPRTGLYLNWTSWSNCNNWTDGTGSYTSSIANSNAKDNSTIYFNDVSCSNLYTLYCAEQ